MLKASKFSVIIAGDREYFGYKLVKEKVFYFLQNKLSEITIISGGASGVDAWGREKRFTKSKV